MGRFQSQARLLKVLAHPTRLRLLNALCGGEECVCHLTVLVRQRQAYISQQLMFLRQAGLLADRKEGSRVYYRIKDERVFRILETINAIDTALDKPPGRQTIANCPCPKCATREKRSSKKRAVSGPKRITNTLMRAG